MYVNHIGTKQHTTFFFEGGGGLNSLLNWYQKVVRALQLDAIHVNLPGIELYFLFVYIRHSHVELNTYLVVDYPTKEETTFNYTGQSFKQVKCMCIELHYIHNHWKNSESALLMHVLCKIKIFFFSIICCTKIPNIFLEILPWFLLKVLNMTHTLIHKTYELCHEAEVLILGII